VDTIDAAPDIPPEIVAEFPPPVTPLHVDGLLAVANPGNVVSYFVVWTTDRPATTALDVDCGDHAATISSETLTTDHEVVVLGLYDGAACTFTAGGVAEDGVEAAEAVDVVAGPLPEGLPALTLAVNDADRVQPGWTAFNLSDTLGDSRPVIAVVDEVGRYRWYHVRDTATSASAMVVRRVPEGFLVGGGSDGGKTWPAIIGLDGQVVWEADLEKEHHEILPWGEDGLMYLTERETCPDPEVIQSGAIVIHDKTTEQPLWDWVFCEHFSPDSDMKDWDHSNALDPFPGGDAVLLSARNLHRVFKVDLETGEIQWSLGVSGDFERTDGGVGAPFLRQHAAELIGEDRVILFDNGKVGVRENSGAVEIAFDEATMEYGVVWSWYADPPIFAKVWGDADRLENGNTLITFGRRQELQSHLIEVTKAGERVWELLPEVGWGWYRAERMEPLPAGHVATQDDAS